MPTWLWHHQSKRHVGQHPSATLPPVEKSQEFTCKTWLIKSHLGHLIKRPGKNADTTRAPPDSHNTTTRQRRNHVIMLPM